MDAKCEVIAGTNHFTVVDELIRPGSTLLTAIVALAHERWHGRHRAHPQTAAE